MTESPEEVFCRAIKRGGTELYQGDDAEIVLSIYKERSLRVLGIDSFVLTERTKMQLLEHSIDLSTASYAGFDDLRIYEIAFHFISSRKHMGFYFEIVPAPHDKGGAAGIDWWPK